MDLDFELAKYHLPWELTAKLAYLGMNIPGYQYWSIRKRKVIPRKYLSDNSYLFGNVDNRYYAQAFMERCRKFEQTKNVNVFSGGWPIVDEASGMVRCPIKPPTFIAVTIDQAKDWFRKHYNIDFAEDPIFGITKQYQCNILTDKGLIKTGKYLSAKEASLGALEYLADNMKQLPGLWGTGEQK